jgi:hypothetical protein
MLMTRLDQGRRAASVLLVVLCLLAVPAAANAVFTARSAAGLGIGTDRMETPAAVTGTYRCIGGFSTEGFDVSVSGFTDAGPVGASYKYSLLRRTTAIKTATSTAHSQTLSSGNVMSDGGSTAWTVTIQSVLGSWTGTPYTRTITCANGSSATGTL